jgi:hypothetical protein
VDFVGPQKVESRGVVDLMAIRKDHRRVGRGLKRGDLLEIVLIQVKGGSAPRPTRQDVARLAKVAKNHRAKAVVLAEWRPREKLKLLGLRGSVWKEVSPSKVFG